MRLCASRKNPIAFPPSVNRLALDSFLDEATLIDLIANKLRALRTGMVGPGVAFIDAMLSMEAIPCKANLLTRVADVDELEEENELGVYTAVPNPLLTASREGPSSDLSRNAASPASSNAVTAPSGTYTLST